LKQLEENRESKDRVRKKDYVKDEKDFSKRKRFNE